MMVSENIYSSRDEDLLNFSYFLAEELAELNRLG